MQQQIDQTQRLSNQQQSLSMKGAYPFQFKLMLLCFLLLLLCFFLFVVVFCLFFVLFCLFVAVFHPLAFVFLFFFVVGAFQQFVTLIRPGPYLFFYTFVPSRYFTTVGKFVLVEKSVLCHGIYCLSSLYATEL